MEKYKEILKNILVEIIALIIFICIGYGIWIFTRNLDYKYYYKSLIKSEVDNGISNHVYYYHQNKTN